MTAYPFRDVKAKLREVIEVTDTWGSGTEDDPIRTVTCYFDKQGNILAVNDPEHPARASAGRHEKRNVKTLEQILEGVTAGGQWRADGAYLRESGHTYLVGEFYVKASRQAEKDASYAAWAARNAPALVRALDLMITAPNSSEAMRVARNAMAEALRDS